METIELGKVVNFLDHLRVPVTESDRSKGRFPYYGANGVQGFVDDFIFNEPLVLLAEDGGHFGSKTRPIAFKVEGKYWVNNHAHVLRPKSDYNIDYLHRVLSYYDVTHYINGATRPKLTKGNAERMPIPFPSLPEQKRIAAILDKADRLRRQRRFAETLSDSFLQSVFIKMFGDPVANTMNWPKEAFAKVCKTRLGKMLDEKRETGLQNRPYLRNTNVKWSDFDLAEVNQMDFDEKDRKEFRLLKGDILICEGGEIGRSAIWNNQLPECYFQKALHRARPYKEKAVPEYIVHLMWALARREGFAGLSSQATIAHLTGEKLAEMNIPVPPRPLQEKFAAIVQKFERIRRQQREATRQAEHLFQTLLHRAFRGEL